MILFMLIWMSYLEKNTESRFQGEYPKMAGQYDESLVWGRGNERERFLL